MLIHTLHWWMGAGWKIIRHNKGDMNQLPLLLFLSHFSSSEIKTLLPLLHILPVSFQSLVRLMTNAVGATAVNTEAATGVSQYPCHIICEALKIGRCCCIQSIWGVEGSRKLLVTQTWEIHSEQWLNELGCHSDAMCNLFVKLITPRCLILGLVLCHRRQLPLFTSEKHCR